MKSNRFIIFLFSIFLVFGIAASVQATSFTYKFVVELEKKVKDDYDKYKYEGPVDLLNDILEVWKFEFKYYDDGTSKTKVEAWNTETVIKEKVDKTTEAVTYKEEEVKVGKIKSYFEILDEFRYVAVLDEDNLYSGSPFYILGNVELGDKRSTFEGILTNVNPDPVPEPATMLLVGGGLLGIAFAGKKRKR